MRLLIVIGMVSALGGLYAGQVGEYLGLSKGKIWAYTGTTKDSTFGLPSMTSNFQDTVKILNEFLYEGDSAYLEESIRISDIADKRTLTDTLWEKGDSLMGSIHLGETAIIGILYKIPFEIGKSWRTSGDTLYIIDIDGDGEDDTMKVIEDIVEVISQEDISVPLGEIEDAYKLKGTFKAEGWVSFLLGHPFTVEVYSSQWYKPFFGQIKDTSYQIINAYYNDSLIYAQHIWESRELTYTAGIEEKRVIKPCALFKIKENPFHNELSISFSLDKSASIRVHLYDAMGREVERIDRHYPSGQHILRYKLEDLPSGVYFLKIYQNGREVGGEKAIKIE